LLINASLRRPGRARNGFDYGEYLKRNGIYALCYTYSGAVTVAGHGKGNMFYDLSFRARQKYIDIIYASMPRAEAMMMDGIMLGNKKVIAPDIFDDFKKTGTAHILAVSGMNASLIAMFIFVMLKLFGVKRRYSALLTIIFILIFTVITGAQASIIRAAVMASFVLAGYIFEREPDTMNSLAIAAFFIMLFNPASIFDTGFLLSFLATMGLIYLNKKAASYFVFIPKWASVGLVTTVTAQIFIVPVMINTFGYISLISVAANVLVVPLAEFLTIAGFAMWAAGLVSAGAARIFGASCWIMVKAMLFVCAKLAAVPFAAVSTVAMPGIFMVF
jgi:competence protein ComEC